ncbi:DUF4365 domain-containing protein [Devosia salina]|uniref:DUF4365 domain-containing protein n=1 Tax=Devosia salina TaxID=2860336 RepID=A0ABX8WIG7_9HYPH|nr:DUF4365 domain-containing protein [Devosia salina]QYO78685.1 DUF4365 domain-containing protein [Devosia salina]
MSNLLPTALLAQRAVLAVSRVLNLAGAVAEVIRNDFGEDLIVQSQLRGVADSFGILVQVKGTRLRLGRDGMYSFRAETGHLLRWASHYQPVLVCVFDDVTSSIYSFCPRRKFSLWDLSTTNHNSITIKFDKSHLFDRDTAAKFIWECRADYYQRNLNWYDEALRTERAFSGAGTARRQRHLSREKSLIAFDLLKSIDLVRENEMNPTFLDSVRNCSKNFAKDNESHPDDKLSISDVFLLCVIAHFERQVGFGMPVRLAEYCAEIAAGVYAAMRPDLWEELKGRFDTA